MEPWLGGLQPSTTSQLPTKAPEVLWPQKLIDISALTKWAKRALQYKGVMRMPDDQLSHCAPKKIGAFSRSPQQWYQHAGVETLLRESSTYSFLTSGPFHVTRLDINPQSYVPVTPNGGCHGDMGHRGNCHRRLSKESMEIGRM